MSVISLLIFDSARLPTFDAMRTESVRGGEAIDLFDPVDLGTHAGYLPVRVSGRETGFEYYFEAIDAEALPPGAAELGTHNIITNTGSSFEEGRAALIFLKIAARLTEGTYLYPDDGIIIPPDQVGTYLDAQIWAYGVEIERQLALGKQP